MHRLALATVPLVLFAAACGAEAPEGPDADFGEGAQPFVGATPGGEAFPEVVSIVTYYPESAEFSEQWALCSGVLVAPHVVLTAAFCLGPDVVVTDDGNGCATYAAPATLPTMAVGFGPETGFDDDGGLATGLPNQLAVTDLVIAPNDGCTNKLALVVLGAKVDAAYATPRALRSEAATAGEAITAVGYGPDDAYVGLYDTKQSVEATVTCLEPDCDQMSGAEEAFVAEGAIPCLGDGGGPALDGDGEVLGLAASSDNGVCDQTAQWGGYVHVPDFADWITTTIATFPEPADSFTPPEPMGTGGAGGTGGEGAGGGGTGGGGDGAGGSMGGSGAGANAAGEPLDPADDGCACSAPGAPERGQGALGLLAFGLLTAAGRRRRVRR